MSEIERLDFSLANLIPVGIFRADKQGRVLFANDALLRIVGLAAEDLSGRRWASLHHPDDRESVRRMWAELAKVDRGDQSADPVAYRLVKPDGTVVCVQASIAPQFDDDGKLIGHLGAITDITREYSFGAETEHRKLMEKALAESERLYATLIATAPVGIFRCDAAGDIIF